MSNSLNVRAMYFSGTGTTEKITVRIADELCRHMRKDDEACEASSVDREELGSDHRVDICPGVDICPAERCGDIDFTPPSARQKHCSFGSDDVVVFGVPTIAGRVPNVLLPFLETLEGGGAMAVPVVLYGNRNFDDSLIELRNILESRGFHTVAAAAFIGEHSFSRLLAAGRPDEEDMEDADRFADYVADKIGSIMTAVHKIGDTFDRIDHYTDKAGDSSGSTGRLFGKSGLLEDMSGQSVREGLLARMCPVPVEGQDPLRPYYRPRDRKGNFIDILKVKPKLDEDKCTGCGICVEACPMGSIKPDAPGIVDGICIKCCGCEKKCPEGALYFDDPGYIYHKEELEAQYTERKEPAFFL